MNIITLTPSDFAAWTQAITGIAALILAVITMLQSKQIKELKDIADEQSKQTRIFAEMLTQAKFEHLESTAPKFRAPNYHVQSNFLPITLLNARATIVALNVTTPDSPVKLDIQKGTVLAVTSEINLTYLKPAALYSGECRFELNFKDNDEIMYRQQGCLFFAANLTRMELYSRSKVG